MVALGGFGTGLTTLNPTKLFDTAMIGFNHPSPFSQLQPRQIGHRQVIGGPVFNVVFCNHYLENLDKAKPFQMDDGAGRREGD